MTVEQWYKAEALIHSIKALNRVELLSKTTSPLSLAEIEQLLHDAGRDSIDGDGEMMKLRETVTEAISAFIIRKRDELTKELERL